IKVITVNLATDAAGAVASKPADIVAAINNDLAAKTLVTATAPTSATGFAAAFAPIPLAPATEGSSLALTAAASDQILGDVTASASFQWSVTKGGAPFALPAGTPT